MLKQRIITALILIPLMLLMLFYAGSSLWALFTALISLLALWEYARMTPLKHTQQVHYLCATGVFMFIAYLGNWQLPSLVWAIVLAFWLLIMPTWLDQKWHLTHACKAQWVGWLLILPFWFGLMALRPDTDAAVQLLALMILVWLADSVAYFSGRALGKRKLAPLLSPKKSWEGVMGGLIAVWIYTILAHTQGWLFTEYSLLFALCATTVLTFVSVGGDLLESWFKRACNIKDSSQLLPGHGGVFDRIDSLVAVISVYAAVQALWS